MEDKYYGFNTYDRDIIENANYIIDQAEKDPEFMAENFDIFRAAMEIQTANQRRVRKSEIEKRKLNQKHQQKLKRTGFYGFIAGSVLMAALSWAKPQFLGGEQLATDAYHLITEDGYGWMDYENGIHFNHGTEYVDYEDAMDDIVHILKSNGMSDADIDVALGKIFHISPSNSTLAERNEAKRDRYYEYKYEQSQEVEEEKGMVK